jgi:hypothetical protein
MVVLKKLIVFTVMVESVPRCRSRSYYDIVVGGITILRVVGAEKKNFGQKNATLKVVP